VLLSALFELLFPAACAGCGSNGAPLCEVCTGLLPATAYAAGAGRVPVLALGRYAGRLRRAILCYKRGRRDVGAALGRILAERVHERIPAHAVLVPVPAASPRRRERGFEQSALLARALAERCGRPVLLALRQTARDAQRGRTRAARLAARGRFACVAGELIEGAEVVLVDDVLTTGATLLDCERALAVCGAKVRLAVVLAFAEAPSRR
jgi:ComF family protein